MEKEKNRLHADKIGQEQFQTFVFNQDISWQEIIYDLINTEQLDPWDIDLAVLSQKYLEKVRLIEEANFVLSSRVLLVASLMLRIKSELLMDRYIKSLDEILFNKQKQEVQETFKIEEYDEGEYPELLLRTPLPRFKKVSINELMQALGNAIKTENRRGIRRQIEEDSQERIKFFMPKKTISLSDRIKAIYSKISGIFQTQERIKFSEFSGNSKEEKISTFIPLLHLDTHDKLWLHQENHFDEIWIHKDGSQFQMPDEMNEIITDTLEEQFEESLEEEDEIKVKKSKA